MVGTFSVFALVLSSASSSSLDVARAIQPQPVTESTPTIVVTAQTRDLRRALEECLARNCPVNEDIDASTALAESLFIAGEYEDAHSVLRRSLGRNRGAAARFPEAVSDLYRANSRVTRHLGLDREAQRSTYQTLRALQAGLPAEDHRHYSARLEVSQMLLAFGNYDEAKAQLRELAEIAQAAGRDDVVATTVLRRLWIDYVREPSSSGNAMRRMAALAAGSDRGLAIGARLLMVRIHSERGQSRQADALIAELSRLTGTRVLLFSPPYQLDQREDRGASAARVEMMRSNAASGDGGSPILTANLQDLLVDNMEDKWIDVGFWIDGQGRVDDVRIVRRSPGEGWENPLMESIQGRRYTASETGERTYRLERYSYTSAMMPVSGSRIAQRSPRARVEYMDLSEPQTAPD